MSPSALLAGVVGLLLAPLPGWCGSAPYAESFESYTNGHPMAQVAGWETATNVVVSTDAAALAALAAYTNAGGVFPLADPHGKVLDLGGWTSNAVASATGGVVVVDVLALATPRDMPPSDDPTMQLAVYVATNGHAVVWHQNRTNAAVNEWRELTNSPVLATDEWARITIRQDQAAGMFQLVLNATNVVVDDAGWTSNNGARPGSWFYMVQTNQAMAQFCTVGELRSYLDDLVVTTRGLAFSTNAFLEAPSNDGQVDNSTPLTIGLAWDTFAGTNGQDLALSSDLLTVSNLPAGLELAAIRTSPTQLIVTVNGIATAHEAAHSVSNVALRFGDGAFALGKAWDVDGASTTGLAVRFGSSSTPLLTYDTTAFSERPANDGVVTGVAALLLAAEEFAGTNGQDLAASGHVTSPNLPAGLAVSVLRVDAQHAVLSLVGQAADHTATESLTNLTVRFLDGAFAGGDAAAVSNAARVDIRLTFLDPPVVAYDGTVFDEVGANDGAVAHTLQVRLTGDGFVSNGVLVADTHFAVAGVPAGLTLAVAAESATQAVVSLTGTAASHAVADSAAVGFRFLDAAFQTVGASNITGASNTFQVVFRDPPVVAASPAAFTEAVANDGTLGNSVALTLTGDTFTNAAFTEGVAYTVSGVPAGLTLALARLSATQLVATLDGQAAAHGAADGVTVVVTLQDGAFDTVSAADIVGVTQSIGIVYRAAPVLEYGSVTFTEAAANDGTIGNTLTVTLAGDAFTVGPFTEGGQYAVSGVPAGLAASVNRLSATQAVVALTGRATAHTAAAGTTLTIDWLDGAFQAVSAANIVGASRSLNLVFRDPPVLACDTGRFTERGDDVGAIGNSVALTLAGEVFAAGPWQAGVHYTVTGVPEGLTLGLARSGDALAVASLAGVASAHSNANDTVVTLTLLDAAFQSVAVSNMVGTTTNLVVDFIETPPANTVPFVDSFEAYGADSSVVGTNGWTGESDDMARVSTEADVVAGVAGYARGWPLITPHTQVLQVAGAVTNRTRSVSGRRVFVDFMEYVSGCETAPSVGAGDQMAFYVNTNQQPVIWHRDVAGATNAWLVLTNAVVATGAWHRITVYQDYASNLFRVKVDDQALVDAAGWTGHGGTQPGSWFHMVQTNGYMSQAAFVGGSWLMQAPVDDVAITYEAPLAPGAVFKFR